MKAYRDISTKMAKSVEAIGHESDKYPADSQEMLITTSMLFGAVMALNYVLDCGNMVGLETGNIDVCHAADKLKIILGYRDANGEDGHSRPSQSSDS